MSSEIYSKINDGLAVNFTGRNYRWHQLRNFAIPRIFTDDMDTKDAITDWLSSEGYEFNSYTERGDKRKSYLLRGIVYGDDNDNIGMINAALLAAKIDCANLRVHRFTTGYMKRNRDKIGAPIYQIVVSGSVTDKSITTITKIGSFSARFEKMMTSTTRTLPLDVSTARKPVCHTMVTPQMDTSIAVSSSEEIPAKRT